MYVSSVDSFLPFGGTTGNYPLPSRYCSKLAMQLSDWRRSGNIFATDWCPHARHSDILCTRYPALGTYKRGQVGAVDSDAGVRGRLLSSPGVRAAIRQRRRPCGGGGGCGGAQARVPGGERAGPPACSARRLLLVVLTGADRLAGHWVRGDHAARLAARAGGRCARRARGARLTGHQQLTTDRQTDTVSTA